MDLYTVLYGKSKKKMKPIMVDSLKKCQNYMDARSNSVKGFHRIEEAAAGATTWRQKSSTIGGNKDSGPVARINRHGTETRNGYIGKNGFNQHT